MGGMQGGGEYSGGGAGGLGVGWGDVQGGGSTGWGGVPRVEGVWSGWCLGWGTGMEGALSRGTVGLEEVEGRGECGLGGSSGGRGWGVLRVGGARDGECTGRGRAWGEGSAVWGAHRVGACGWGNVGLGERRVGGSVGWWGEGGWGKHRMGGMRGGGRTGNRLGGARGAGGREPV